MNVRQAAHQHQEDRSAGPAGGPGGGSGGSGGVGGSRRLVGHWIVTALGLVVGIAALAWAVAVVVDLTGRIGDYPQIPAGSERSIQISEPGDRVVYYEGPEADRVTGSVPELDDELTIAVTDPAGTPVDLEPYETGLRYRLFDRAGEAVASFPADTPGTYEVAVSDEAPAEAVVAVGEGVPTAAMLRIAAAVALTLVAFSTAAVAGVAARRRTRPGSHRPAG